MVMGGRSASWMRVWKRLVRCSGWMGVPSGWVNARPLFGQMVPAASRLACAAGFQDGEGVGVEGDDTVPGVGFRLGELGGVADLDELPADGEGCVGDVDIVDVDGDGFTASEPPVGDEVEDRVERVAMGVVEEPPGLRWGPDHEWSVPDLVDSSIMRLVGAPCQTWPRTRRASCN